ncbi:MAG: amidohydrolase family protein [Alphaproteobacteria bacterium]|nr:amidohydrolase family protein [Alphaproteobacteria bacterium]
MIIDIFTHVFPASVFERIDALGLDLGPIGKRTRSMRLLFDMDARFTVMDGFDDYRQVVALPNPPLEDFADAETGAELARAANDALAELVARHPDRFAGFIAALSLHDPEGAAREAQRACRELGAKGVQLFTNVAGRPLDDPAFAPVFEAMAGLERPVWLHPARTPETRDFLAEEISRFEAWISLGWPFETSVAMLRLSLTGMLERHPGLRIITHHLGGMVPYHEARLAAAFRNLGRRSADEDYQPYKAALSRDLVDYLKMFYGDTAMHGAVDPLRLGLSFFGAGHVVFASDAPYGPIDKCLAAIDALGLDADRRQKLLAGNAMALLA